MSTNSKIEWTDHTFNAWRGCVEVHEGCEHCYAAAMSKRNPQVLGTWGENGTRVVGAEAYWTAPEIWNARAATLGERHRVFCASLADVFEDWDGPISTTDGGRLFVNPDNQWMVTDADAQRTPSGSRFATLTDVRRRLFRLIDATPHLDWLLLTKRPENIRRMWPKMDNQENGWKLNNVWLGTSISLQEHADKQIPELLKCRDLAPVLFLSVEPMLGPIDLTAIQTDVVEINALTGTHGVIRPHRGYEDRHVDWVICGGESGPHARPMHPDWARSLRDQCHTADVPFFFKQWGEHVYFDQAPDDTAAKIDSSFNAAALDAADDQPWKVGKKAAGRLLDCREHNAFPQL